MLTQERLQAAAGDVDAAAQQRLLFGSRLSRAGEEPGASSSSAATSSSACRRSNRTALWSRCTRMGQLLFFPPNVKGWDGGAAWLNSQTLLTRENFACASCANPKMDATRRGSRQALRRSIRRRASSRTLTQTILQGDVSPASRAAARRLSRRRTDGGARGCSRGENADERIRGAAYLTMAMPAYQLA